MKNRNQVIDILRAIGIVLVVLGHCTDNVFLSRFVYIFHLPLFFLISGYLYKEVCCDAPWEYIGLRMKNYLKAYVIYNGILVILHNVFYYMDLLQSTTVYNLNDITIKFLDSFLFTSTEAFAAALWFIPVLLASLIIFNFIYYITRSVDKNKEIERAIIIVLCTLLGIYLNRNNLSLGLHYQTSLVVLPFIYIGQLVRKHGLEAIKINKLLALLIVVITLLTIKFIPGRVDLSQNNLWHSYLFYPLSIGMLYVTYVIGFVVNQHFKKITNILVYIGIRTLPIMGLHIVCYKLLDFIVIHLFTKNYDVLPRFTVSYSQFWPIYTIVGIIGPLLFLYCIEKIKIIVKTWYGNRYNKGSV